MVSADMSGQALQNPFWSFSLKAWELKSLRSSLLSAQGKNKVDINLALFCIWSASRGYSCQNIAEELKSISAKWQENYLNPIRFIREQSNKDGYKDLKSQLLKLELSCEREEQDQLYALAVGLIEDKLAPVEVLKGNLVSIGYADLFKTFPKDLFEKLV